MTAAEEDLGDVKIVGEGAVAPAAHAAPHAQGRGEDARHEEEGDLLYCSLQFICRAPFRD